MMTKDIVLFCPSTKSGAGIGNTTRSLVVAEALQNNISIWIRLAADLDVVLPDNDNLHVMTDDCLPDEARVAVCVIDTQCPVEAEMLVDLFTNRYPGIRLVLLDHTGDVLAKPARYISLRGYNAASPPQIEDGLLEGLEYAIFRDEFQNLRSQGVCISAEVRSVLLTLGGEDSAQFTVMAMRWLERWVEASLNVTVLLGPLNRNAEIVSDMASRMTQHRYEVSGYRDGIAREMLRNDLVICGGGGTVMELAFLGVPVIALPQNSLERSFLRLLDNVGFSVNHIDDISADRPGVTHRLFIDQEERGRHVKAGWDIFDGKGAERISRVIDDEIKQAELGQ